MKNKYLFIVFIISLLIGCSSNKENFDTESMDFFDLFNTAISNYDNKKRDEIFRKLDDSITYYKDRILTGVEVFDTANQTIELQFKSDELFDDMDFCIKERNVYVFEITEHDSIYAEGKKTIVPDTLGVKIKNFIVNPKDEPYLSEKVIHEIEYFGRISVSISAFMIYCKMLPDSLDQRTSWHKLFSVINLSLDSYNDARDDISMKKWNKKYNNLEFDKRKSVAEILPIYFMIYLDMSRVKPPPPPPPYREFSIEESVQESTNELDYILVDTSIPKTLTTQNFNIQVKTNLHKWVNYYDKLSDDFNINSFRNTSTTILQPYQEPLDDTLYVDRFFDLYEPYLIWSPDSSRTIDLYSYSHVLEYDSEGKVYGMRDVDCQLALMDRVNQKRIIINTWGPATEFQDAFWLNNDTIIVTGIEYEFDDTYKPYYCMIDLQSYLVRYYEQEKVLGFKNNTYIDMIFEEIEFK